MRYAKMSDRADRRLNKIKRRCQACFEDVLPGDCISFYGPIFGHKKCEPELYESIQASMKRSAESRYGV